MDRVSDQTSFLRLFPFWLQEIEIKHITNATTADSSIKKKENFSRYSLRNRVVRVDLSVLLCLVAQSYPTLCDPIDCTHQAPLSIGILQARILEWVARPFLSGLPNPGIEPRSPALQADSLPAEPPGKPFSGEVILDPCKPE